MTIFEILKELELYTGRFPKKAMQAAIKQREAITPELLRVLENAAENPVRFAAQQDYMLHLFALYLLAQFREKRAYPLIVNNGMTWCSVADLPAPELLEEVRQAYADGLVDPGFAGLEGIERDLAGQGRWRRKPDRLITDAIDEMQWWPSFHPKPTWPSRQLQPEAWTPPSSDPGPPPAQRAKIGRNDPCRCGSGKKCKKCCGQS